LKELLCGQVLLNAENQQMMRVSLVVFRQWRKFDAAQAPRGDGGDGGIVQKWLACVTQTRRLTRRCGLKLRL
jgi:hypothetical protein